MLVGTLLVHGWTMGKHGFTRLTTDQTWGEATTFPFIILFVHGHMANIQMSFCLATPKLEVLKFPKLGLSWLWRLITLCVNLQLRQGLKKGCNPRWELFNNMQHGTTYMQVNQGNPNFLWSGVKLTFLIIGPNLCFQYPNGSWEPILNI